MSLSFSRRGRGVPVLMFHGICERIPQYAVYPGGRTCLIEIEAFAKVVAWCAERFHILRLSELDEYLEVDRRTRPGMILTFDDGLASVLDLAVPILRKHGASATMFVTTEWTSSGATPAIFTLERIIWERVPVSLTIRVGSKQLDLHVASRADAPRVITQVWDFLFASRHPPLKVHRKDVSIDGAPWDGAAPEDRHFWHPASWEELRGAVDTGALEIGSHMVSHAPLPWLSEAAQLDELRRSHDELTTTLQCPVTACSYPHGMADDRTRGLAETVYRWCFTNQRGRVCATTLRGAAPRYHVPGECPALVTRELVWGRVGRLFRKIGL